MRCLPWFFILFLPLNAGAEKVSFNRQIRPLLSDQCFACHGPDSHARKGELRLDVREIALKPAKSGEVAIVPGDPAKSALIARIHTTEADDQMPPGSTHKSLSSGQKELFQRWIAEGAEYEGHWAYLPPLKATIPVEAGHPIDFLIKKRQDTLGLQFSPEADQRTLIRRLYTDLHGLPAPAAEVEAFVHDVSPDAYGKLVDRLLASAPYGERMAVWWLDLVRYADSAGYHSDKARNVSPFRDYVIDSFNLNKPFDQLTTEHLAGDLLPNASRDQRIGSCYNKLLLTTDEGGAQTKDYEARYLQDRVRAVGTVWLAQTWMCSQCHDHKFDPMLTKDFYSMGAFFADLEEGIIASPEQGMMVLKPGEQQVYDALTAGRHQLQERFDADTDESRAAQQVWEKARMDALQATPWTTLKFSQRQATEGVSLEDKGAGIYLAAGPSPDKTTYTLTAEAFPPETTALRIEVLPDEALPAKGSGRASNGNFVITEVKARLIKVDGSVAQELSFAKATATIEQSGLSDAHPDKKWSAASAIDQDARGDSWGWAILPEVTKPQSLSLEFRAPVAALADTRLIIEILQNHGTQHTLGNFRCSATTGVISNLPPALAAALQKPADQRSPEDRTTLLASYKALAPELAEIRQKLADDSAKIKATEDAAVRCIVSTSTPNKRTVRVLPRGDFLNETGAVVTAGLPGYLPKPTIEGREPNRLDLARWLVARENPLTARVLMNRLWKMFFGMGLSKTVEDFGLQGEMPPNAELLDWLACEMVDRHWNIKDMVRLMVTSRAYRQTSHATPDMLTRDPENRELARQSRFRLDAEFVRDFALATSGLLVPDIGGASVKPYQPEGYWENLNFPSRTWEASHGPDQYRRGLYTWWQRMFLHPAMLAFDAPSREECAVERSRSNIPQQALVLLNDPSFVEAARTLAAHCLAEPMNDDPARLDWLWKRALQRPATEAERTPLLTLLAKHRAEFKADANAAQAFLNVGLTPGTASDPAELAAWSSLARVVLNLHEFITRQ